MRYPETQRLLGLTGVCVGLGIAVLAVAAIVACPAKVRAQTVSPTRTPTATPPGPAATPTRTPIILGPSTPTPTPNAPAQTPTPGTWRCYAAGQCLALDPGPCSSAGGIPVAPGDPCPPPGVTTPTPTPPVGPTATPTPTAPPALPITLTPLSAMPGRESYLLQAATVVYDPPVVGGRGWYATGNGGHCAGDPLGPQPYGIKGGWEQECALLIDGTGPVPKYRRVHCTGKDSVDEYEIQWTLWPHLGAEFMGFAAWTLRPGVPARTNDGHALRLGRITLKSFDDAFPFLLRDWWSEAYTLLYPIGWGSRAGQWKLWVNRVPFDPVDGHWTAEYIAAFTVGADAGGLLPDPAYWPNRPAPIDGGLSQVAIDRDGSLVGWENAYPPEAAVMQWRSTDEWKTAQMLGGINAPAGYGGLWDCHSAVNAGGVVIRPQWGVCLAWKSDDWSTAGQWAPFLFAEQGAAVPANFLTPAVAWSAP